MTTHAGEPVVKLSVEDVQMDRELLQTFCFFDGGSTMWVITYSRWRDADSDRDEVVDEVMLTFVPGD